MAAPVTETLADIAAAKAWFSDKNAAHPRRHPRQGYSDYYLQREAPTPGLAQATSTSSASRPISASTSTATTYIPLAASARPSAAG